MWQYDKKLQKMINYDDVTKENIKEDNPNWPQNLNHAYRILIIVGSGSGRTIALHNLIKQQDEAKKKNTLVSGNVGVGKNFHPGGLKFIFLIKLIEFFK